MCILHHWTQRIEGWSRCAQTQENLATQREKDHGHHSMQSHHNEICLATILKQHISQLISQWSTACRQWLTVCKDDANGSIGTERAGGEREVVLGGNQSAVAKVQVK